MASLERRAAAQALMERLLALRVRCQRQTNSFVTPMGDEIYYRYQQSLIDEATTTLAALLRGPQSPARNPNADIKSSNKRRPFWSWAITRCSYR
jgi:hypothetical protein